MEGTLEQGRARKRQRARFVRLGVIAGLALALVAVTGTAVAKNMSGTKRGEKIVGTKGADKIKGKGGNDKIKGRGGNDAINGGKGRDRVVGGPGLDRHLGAAGADLVKSADNRRDKAVNGGPGNDRCIVDTALELSVVRGCEAVINGGGGGGGGPGSGPGSLALSSGTGLVCGSQLPTCVFTLNGTGADAAVGTVTGGGGVTGVGASVVATGDDWTAAGAYGCTADGYLRVTIGSESIDVPIDCTV